MTASTISSRPRHKAGSTSPVDALIADIDAADKQIRAFARGNKIDADTLLGIMTPLIIAAHDLRVLPQDVRLFYRRLSQDCTSSEWSARRLFQMVATRQLMCLRHDLEMSQL